jgi:hypothetical protein
MALFMFSISITGNMFCKVLQDLISSNKTVHEVSHEDAYYVKLIARNPDTEFDGVRCNVSNVIFLHPVARSIIQSFSSVFMRHF